MFDPQTFEDREHEQMPDWLAHLLIMASYALAFLAGWIAG